MSDMEYITYKMIEISKLNSGGDRPKIYSDTKTNECCFPIFSNGLQDEGLYGYTNKATMSSDTITVSARGANIGEVFYRKEDFFPIVRLITIIPDSNYVHSKYLYYYLKKVKIEGSGSAQPQITVPFFSRHKIVIPKDVEYQKKVAYILSAYDNLIENNNKRIKLLEQMAENLYKEWFVRFRFPEYENVEFVGTLPIGWQYQPISESMDFFDSQRVPLSSMQRDEMEKIYPYYGAAKLMDYVDDYLFDGEYLLLGEDGTVITTDGFPVLQLVNDKFWVNNHAHVIRGKGNISTRFLYLTFCRFPITGVVTGSAQPKISKGRLEKLKILVPDAITMEHFNNLINPMFDEINVLKKQLIRITQQRDMLLPRLMSGKLEV